MTTRAHVSGLIREALVKRDNLDDFRVSVVVREVLRDQTAGTLSVTMAVQEPRDIWDHVSPYQIIAAADAFTQRNVTIDTTEADDVASMHIGVAIGMTMDATEPSDGFTVGSGGGASLSSKLDGEYVYVAFERLTMWLPWSLENLPFIQPSELEVYVTAEFRDLTVAAEDRLIMVPAVESGAWV